MIIPVEADDDSPTGRKGSFISGDPIDLYQDVLVSIDRSRGLNNGQPSALAHWIHALGLRAGDRVFHAGCGVGYYTAILAEMVGPQGRVVAAEIDPELAARAKQNLAAWPHVAVHEADAAMADTGMCDAMLINAGVTCPHPAWLEHLKIGGRMVAPITCERGGLGSNGVMIKATRLDTGYSAGILSYVSIYPCASAREQKLEGVVLKALKNRRLLRLRSVRLEPHALTGTCVVHGDGVCLSEADPPSSPACQAGANPLS